MEPVRIDHVLRKRRSDQQREDPWKHAPRSASGQAAGDEQEVGGVVEGSTRRAGRSSAARDPSVKQVRRNRHHHGDRGQRRTSRIFLGDQQRKRKGKREANGSQQIRHGAG
jgi:hypothetical protein